MDQLLVSTILAEAVEVQIKREVGGSYVNGEWVPIPGDPEPIMATVQPVSGTVLRDLPEGERKEAKYTLWSLSPLATDNVVIYGGSQYRIMKAWPRPEGGFTKAVMGLLQP